MFDIMHYLQTNANFKISRTFSFLPLSRQGKPSNHVFDGKHLEHNQQPRAKPNADNWADRGADALDKLFDAARVDCLV